MIKEGKILIVEDSLITRMHLEKLVTKAGYMVAAKTDYAEKVRDLCASQMPNLILMDIMLNGDMTGVDAAEQLRAQAQDIPIIFISALSDANTQSRISNISHCAWVSKPFDHHELVSTISRLLN